MVRKIARTYAFTDSEVRNILIAHLRSKDIPAPAYVGDTSDCTWTKEPNGLRVDWSEEGEMNLPT